MNTGAPGEAVIVEAPAKINLALHVTGKRADGYHLLDTVVAFSGVGDTLTACTADVFSLTLCGRFGASLENGGDNLVLKAARLLSQRLAADGLAPSGGAHFTLQKELPVASGIGGGSADAAAALIALAKLWSLPETFDLKPVAQALGADVPMCLVSQPLQAKGVGDQINTVRLASDLFAVLVNPGFEVPTKAVFAGFGGRFGAPVSQLPASGMDTGWLAQQRNDLQEPAIRLFPQISDTLDALQQRPGLLLARMSGSGATCFGLFADATSARLAAREIALQRPGWWSVATILARQGSRGRYGQFHMEKTNGAH